MPDQTITEVVFANGATKSGPIFLRQGFNGIRYPAGFAGTALTLHRALGEVQIADPDPRVFRPLKDAQGTVLTFPVDLIYDVVFSAEATTGLGWVQFEATDAQTAVRAIQLVFPITVGVG